MPDTRTEHRRLPRAAMRGFRPRDRRGPARVAGVAPAALLTAALLGLVATGIRSRGGRLPGLDRAERLAGERLVFVESPAARTEPARVQGAPPRTSPVGSPLSSRATAPTAPGGTAPTPAREVRAIDAPASAAPRGAPDTGGTQAGLPPRRAGGGMRPAPAGVARPDPPPLDRRQLDSALATVRDQLSALAARGRIPRGADDAGKALAGVGASGLSADARRDLARAAIVDWQRNDAAAQLQEKGRRPALTISRRLSLGGPRPPALSDAEVRAMFERNQARVRRRADSLAWWAESTRVARERAVRDATMRDTARDSAARGAPPVPGDV